MTSCSCETAVRNGPPFLLGETRGTVTGRSDISLRQAQQCPPVGTTLRIRPKRRFFGLSEWHHHRHRHSGETQRTRLRRQIRRQHDARILRDRPRIRLGRRGCPGQRAERRQSERHWRHPPNPRHRPRGDGGCFPDLHSRSAAFPATSFSENIPLYFADFGFFTPRPPPRTPQPFRDGNRKNQVPKSATWSQNRP